MLNGLDHNDPKYKLTKNDANLLMFTSEQIYDVIDLDPYGSVIPFIDSAIKVAKNNTLICATCTDLKVLEGPDIFKCYTMYNCNRAYNISCKQENSIRIALSSISSIAHKYGKTI